VKEKGETTKDNGKLIEKGKIKAKKSGKKKSKKGCVTS
jgi:hypothetical protein